MRANRCTEMNERRSCLLIGALLAAVVAAAPAEAATLTCGGVAPVMTSCTTGTRTRDAGLSHNVAADFNYVGTIESVIAWNGKARTLRCTYTQIGQRVCLISGEFPPIGTTFTHRCRSLVPGTVIGSTLNGVEGGVGTWQCELTV